MVCGYKHYGYDSRVMLEIGFAISPATFKYMFAFEISSNQLTLASQDSGGYVLFVHGLGSRSRSQLGVRVDPITFSLVQ